MGIPWTDTHDNLLKKYHNEGRSFSVIASLIHAETGAAFTKNACVGRAGRLNLERRRKFDRNKPRLANQPRRERPRVKRIAETPYVEVIPAGEPPHLGLSILELDGRCKYARGESNFTFCGQLSIEGGSYCDFHHRLCWRPPEARPVRRAAA